MKINMILLILVAGLTVVVLGGCRGSDEPIQPVFQTNLDIICQLQWHGNVVFHRSAKGELVLLGGSGPAARGVASTDEGRTWHRWPAVHTWPKGWVHAVARKGKELLMMGKFDGEPRFWRSEDEGQTWTGGEPFMDLPIRFDVLGSKDVRRIWSVPGDRILVTKAGRLLVSVTFLLGKEGLGPELVGSLVSEDSGRMWRLYKLFGPPKGYQDWPEGFSEPKLVELADGRIWMVFRTCLGHLWQAFSTDGGRTWGKPSSTGLVSPLAPLNAERIPGTNSVVVVWNNSKPGGTSLSASSNESFWQPRRPLVFAVSHDNCQTWSRPVIVSENLSLMRNIYFSDNEMFIIYEEGSGLDLLAKGFEYRHKLVIYDLKTLLALQPEE